MTPGRALALLLWCAPGLAPLVAQNFTHVSGVILDGSASSVPGALVTVVNENTGFRRVTLSQPDGGYFVPSLDSGLYKITVRKPGFRTVVRFGVRLNKLQPARVDFKLMIGSVQETVSVEGATPMLSNDDGSVATVVARDEIDRLPRNGGGQLGLLELTPGLIVTPATRGEAGQFTVGGQRPNSNSFMVDGVSANSGVSGGGLPAQSTGAALPGMTAFGSLDGLVSQDALEELRVQTSSGAPQFGRLPGAQISLKTRSGSNELHGSFSAAIRNEALNANDWFANLHGDPRAPLRFQDFGATLGGPFRRNRTFFFLSYEGMRFSEPVISRQTVPSLADRESAPSWAQPMLDLFPAPNGPGPSDWTGGDSRPSRFDGGSLRLDQAITSRLTAFLRYNASPSSTQFGSGSVNQLELRMQSLTAGVSLRLKPNLLFDSRINVSRASGDSFWRPADPKAPPACFQFLGAPTPCDYLARLSLAGVGDTVYGDEGLHSQSQFQVNQTGGWNHGAHFLQFGVDYVRVAPFRRDATKSFSVIANTFADLTYINNLWTANSPAERTSAIVEEVSLFAEDTWRIAPRLTLSLGLRWEISPAPVATNFLDPLTNYVPQQQVARPIWQSAITNFAPRAGLAYRLDRRGRTVLRAGGGFYFDSSLSLATDLVNDGPFNVSQYSSGQNGLFSTILHFGFLPDLRLPLVKQWSASIEHAFDDHEVVSLSYAGTTGRDLIRREIGGQGASVTDWLALATNHGASDYHSFQAQYRRRLSRGIEVLASYAWSHSIDNSSSDAGLYWAGSGLRASQDRASSDFDVRHAFSAGFSYELPLSVRGAAWRGWAFDGVVHARTGFPINVLTSEEFNGISFDNAFRPSLIGGQPVWISDSSAPGGQRINPKAFQAASGAAQGTLGRNALAGFGMAQLDFDVRRDLFAREQRSLQLRVEAFNVFNHANFADPVRFLASPLFGQSPSMLNFMLGTGSPGSGLAPMFQGGGARSLQIALRFRF